MTFYGDYHTHTEYSDGVNTCETIVVQAIKRGLKQVAITDHGFLNKWMSLTPAKFEKQAVEIKELRKKYPEIEILHGIEANIMDTRGTVDLWPENVDKLDIIVAGFHRFSDSTNYLDYFRFIMYNGFIAPVIGHSARSILRNTDAYIKALYNCPIDILVHINERATVDVRAVAEVAAELGTFIELNTRHYDLLDKCMDKLLSTKCNFVVNSDGHKPERIGNFDNIVKLIEKYEIPSERIANLGKMPEFTRLKNYKERRKRNG
jgi:Histidinol phosphatase and related hydrolases of the PHP family